MNIKKISSIMSITFLSITPLVILASCSSASYTTLIPKILDEEITRMQSEIAIDGPAKWMQDRADWTKNDWLVSSNPSSGYISGGNVFPENILEIKVSLIDNNSAINFFISVDKNSSNRFLDNKTDWTTQIAIKNN